MQAVDWLREGTLYERDDSGSDMDITFHRRRVGTLGTLVGEVMAMKVAERARMVIDRGVDGMLNIHEIVALAARPDFPDDTTSGDDA